MNTLKNKFGGIVLLMFLSDGDKQIVHYILSVHCHECGLVIDQYITYNQFLDSCPRHECDHNRLLRELVKLDHHETITHYLGTEYPFNDQWKRFFSHRKGWI